MNTDNGVVQRELDSGERLLWTGRPNPGSAAAGSWGGVFGGLFIIAFAIFWMTGASQAGAPAIFPLFGLILV